MIKVGTYYYAYNCGACKKSTPVVDQANRHLVGGYIEKVLVNRLWEADEFHRDAAEEGPRLQQTFKYGGITSTPMFLWEDNVKTTGVPFNEDDQSFEEKELAEFVCVRATKSYLKQVVPDWEMSDGQVRNLVEKAIPRFGRTYRADGGAEYDSFQALYEITRRYG